MEQPIVIVDYGMGNLGSIKNMLKKIGAASIISSDPADIERASKLILPGVGSFDAGMKKIADLGLPSILNQKVLERKTPILGICLGMQLMTLGSEEGVLPGLGWIRANTKRFNFGEGQREYRIPHMGWNEVHFSKALPLGKELQDDFRFYFVHSYHAVCENETEVLSKTPYGYEFASSFQKDNIVGVQFHPEKSHKFGMQFLKEYIELQ